MGIILLQNSKTGGMGAAMGGGAMNAAFGGQGADKLLVRITSGLAVIFMVLAIFIGMLDNPASRVDFSNEPTLSRNKGAVDITAPNNNLQQIETVAPPVKKEDELNPKSITE
tara:strand:- start:3565 stop:3900 length:336 start_codon:yes stop_codon:yes gene_type:complete